MQLCPGGEDQLVPRIQTGAPTCHQDQPANQCRIASRGGGCDDGAEGITEQVDRFGCGLVDYGSDLLEEQIE